MAKGSEKLGCSWWSSGPAGQSSRVWGVRVPGWTSSSGREGDGSDTWQMNGDRSPRTNESAGSQSGQTEEPEVENKNQNMANRFVFSMVGPPKKAGSLLTPVSDTVFDALSQGTLGFNHVLNGGNSSTANQILPCKWLLELPWRAEPRVPLERA